MKRLLASFLALCLLCGGVGAFAAEEPKEENPMPESLLEQIDSGSYYYLYVDEDILAWFNREYPGELENMDWDAYIAEEWSWHESLASMAESWGESEEEVIAYLTEEYVSERVTELAKTIYMERHKTELGGIVGEYGVLTEEGYLTFSVPVENWQGSLYAPAAELATQLGLTDYEDLATWQTSGSQESSWLPVRQAAELMGYTVYWDAFYETAVLINYEQLGIEMDEQLTILNRMWARQLEQSAKGQTGTMTAELTLFDSISGDKIYKGGVDYAQTLDETGYTGKIKLDISNFSVLVQSITESYLRENIYYFYHAYDDAELAESEASLQADLDMVMGIYALLSDAELEIGLSFEDGMASIDFPALKGISALLGEELESFEALEIPGLKGFTIGETMGPMYAEAYRQRFDTSYQYYSIYAYYNYSSPVTYFDTIHSELQQIISLLGDDCVTRSGGKDVLTWNNETLMALTGGEYSYLFGYGSFVPEFSMSISVDDKGDTALDIDLKVNLHSFGEGDVDVLVTGESESNARGGESSAEIHFKNVFKLILKDNYKIG